MINLNPLMTKFATMQVEFMTWRRGELVGTDREGNRYYRDRKKVKGKRERRWVLFNGGEPEATRIPPEWFGWMHHMMDQPLPENSDYHKPWQKPHKPNQSGTLAAYRPPGHPLAGGQRAPATGDYQAWTPAE